MSRLKFVIVLLIALYIITWVRFIPEMQELLVKADDTCIGTSYINATPHPKGIELWSPYINQKRKVNYLYGKNPSTYTNNISSMAIPVAPFLVYFSYEVESHGFKCGQAGFTHLGLDNELKITKLLYKYIT